MSTSGSAGFSLLGNVKTDFEPEQRCYWIAVKLLTCKTSPGSWKLFTLTERKTHKHLPDFKVRATTDMRALGQKVVMSECGVTKHGLFLLAWEGNLMKLVSWSSCVDVRFKLLSLDSWYVIMSRICPEEIPDGALTP